MLKAREEEYHVSSGSKAEMKFVLKMRAGMHIDHSGRFFPGFPLKKFFKKTHRKNSENFLLIYLVYN